MEKERNLKKFNKCARRAAGCQKLIEKDISLKFLY